MSWKIQKELIPMYVGNSNLRNFISSATRTTKSATFSSPTKNVQLEPMSSVKGQMKAFSAQLKQAVSEAEKNAPDSDAWKLSGNAPLSRVSGYTKEDALRRAWDAQQPTIRLDLSGENAAQGAENWKPGVLQSAETLRSFEEQLRTDGLSVKLDDKYWFQLSSDLRKSGYGADASGIAMDGNGFLGGADYLASRAVAAESLITRNAVGKEREEQLEKLRGAISDAVEKMAVSYSRTVGGFLEQNRVSGETEKIYDSVIRGIQNMTEAYRAALSDNKRLSALEGTPNGWLLQDDAYVASAIRGDADVSAYAKESRAAYSMEDLSALGQFVSELSSVERSIDLYSVDEERLGLDFAMLSMKTDVLRNSGNVSENMSSTIRKAAEGYMDAFLKRMDERLTRARGARQAAGDFKGFAPLDRDAVWSVYVHTMRQYQSGGDALRAFQEGASFARNQREGKAAQTNGVYRYDNSASYWDNFFRKSADRSGAYQTSGVTFHDYAAGWNDFKNSVRSGNEARFNLTLYSADYYGNDNLVNVKA